MERAVAVHIESLHQDLGGSGSFASPCPVALGPHSGNCLTQHFCHSGTPDQGQYSSAPHVIGFFWDAEPPNVTDLASPRHGLPLTGTPDIVPLVPLVLTCVRQQEWFVAIDLKDTYFHFLILPQHILFLWFTFEGRAYQH